MSFALVFRVVQRYEKYNSLNNTLISNIDNMTQKDKDKEIQRENLYKAFDYTKYHNIFKQMYSNMKSRIKAL